MSVVRFRPEAPQKNSKFLLGVFLFFIVKLYIYVIIERFPRESELVTITEGITRSVGVIGDDEEVLKYEQIFKK